MMKNFLKNQRGINLITLSIAVIVILVLTNIIIYNAKDGLDVQNLKDMQADIKNLRQKVSNYYTEYGEIPVINDVEYTNTKHIDVISSATDTGKFYVINLSAMDNLTLTYGQDYKKITSEISYNQDEINKLENLYIINADSHNIFYVQGISVGGERLYTDYTTEDVDEKPIELHSNISQENWSPVYNTSAIYKDINKDTAKIPAGFQVSRKQGESTIHDGLVIKNESTGDKYVWIQVPENVFKTANSETDYEKIESDLKTYTTSYEEKDFSDEYYEGCGIETKEEYDKLKNKMLSSIYKNKGFWISQYEAGTTEARTTASSSLPVPISKEGAYPYNYVTQKDAQQVATSVLQSKEQEGIKQEENDTTSSLMFGIQWNLVLKFIETNSKKTDLEIRVDSTSWGNYTNATFDISNGKYAMDSWNDVNGTYSKQSSSNVLFTTGITNRNSILNIYDIAGNLSECTLEKSKDDKHTTRGGSFTQEGTQSASKHQPNVTEDNNDVGFRVTLY